GEGDPLRDRQTLHLVEDGRVRDVRVAAKHLAERNHPYGRAALLHRADLDGRSVGPEEEPALDVEGVLHVTRRMVRRNVEGLEIVEIGLYFGAALEGVPHLEENLLDEGAHLRDRVRRARVLCPAGQ